MRDRILFERKERKRLIPLVDVDSDDHQDTDVTTEPAAKCSTPEVSTDQIIASGIVSSDCTGIISEEVISEQLINEKVISEKVINEKVTEEEEKNEKRPPSVAFDSSFDGDEESLPAPLIPNIICSDDS